MDFNMSGERIMTALMVEDKARLRELFKPTLAMLGCDVVAETGSPREAALLYGRLHPDVVLTNFSLAMGSGLDVLRDILALDPGARIFMFTSHSDEATRDACFKAGACGYIVKNRPIDEFVANLDTVLGPPQIAA